MSWESILDFVSEILLSNSFFKFFNSSKVPSVLTSSFFFEILVVSIWAIEGVLKLVTVRPFFSPFPLIPVSNLTILYSSAWAVSILVNNEAPKVATDNNIAVDFKLIFLFLIVLYRPFLSPFKVSFSHLKKLVLK